MPVLPVLSSAVPRVFWIRVLLSHPGIWEQFTVSYCLQQEACIWSGKSDKIICKNRWDGKCSLYCYFFVLFLVEHFCSVTETASLMQLRPSRFSSLLKCHPEMINWWRSWLKVTNALWWAKESVWTDLVSALAVGDNSAWFLVIRPNSRKWSYLFCHHH